MNEPPAVIPKGWQIRTLAELIPNGDSINYGVVQPGTDFPNGVRVVRVADFVDGSIRIDKLKRIDPAIERAYTRSRLVGDEILIACVGSIGSVALATSDLAGCNIARAVARIRCDESVDRHYLARYLVTGAAQNYFARETRTVAQPTLNIGQIKETWVLLPPLSEQKRIAGILDQADGLRRKRQQALALTDQFLRSTFLDLFGDPVTNPKRWPVRMLGDVIEFVGGSQPPKDTFISEPREGYVRLVQIRDFKTDKYKTYIPIALAKRAFQKDDVMIARYGPPVFQILRGLEGSYNVALMKAAPTEHTTKDFIFNLLQIPTLHSFVVSNSDRTAGQSGVNLDLLNKYEVPILPVDHQRLMSKVFAEIDALRMKSRNALEVAEPLFNSLVQRAFRGDL